MYLSYILTRKYKMKMLYLKNSRTKRVAVSFSGDIWQLLGCPEYIPPMTVGKVILSLSLLENCVPYWILRTQNYTQWHLLTK